MHQPTQRRIALASMPTHCWFLYRGVKGRARTLPVVLVQPRYAASFCIRSFTCNRFDRSP